MLVAINIQRYAVDPNSSIINPYHIRLVDMVDYVNRPFSDDPSPAYFCNHRPGSCRSAVRNTYGANMLAVCRRILAKGVILHCIPAKTNLYCNNACDNKRKNCSYCKAYDFEDDLQDFQSGCSSIYKR